MSDDRLNTISYLYGELDAGASRRFEKKAEQDAELAAELNSLRGLRALYAQDRLPDPDPALSEAILRQEVMLRAPRESLWSQLWMLLMHPAVGLTALLVVVGSAGLLYRLSTPPAATLSAAPTAATGHAPVAGFDEDEVAAPVAVAEKAAVEIADQAVVAARSEKDKAAFAQAKVQVRRGDGTAGQAPALAPAEPTITQRKRAKMKPQSATPREAGESVLQARPEKKERRVSTRGSLRMDPAPQAAAPRPADSLAPGSPAPAPDSVAAGSAGQLTAPSQLQSPGLGAKAKGAAGHVGGVAASAFGGNSVREEAEFNGLRVAAHKPARRIHKRVSSGSGRAQKLTELDRARGRQRVQQEFDSAMVAFDRQHYEDAIDLLRRVQAADPAHKLFGPLPMLMEARSLMRLHRYRQAAVLYETTLREFKKIPNRRHVSRELLACYQASGQTELARRTKRSLQVFLDDADAETATDAAPEMPAAEPAQAPARR